MVRRPAAAVGCHRQWRRGNWPPRAMGADLAYIGLSLHRHKRGVGRVDAYKQMIVEGKKPSDIVYSNLFTGVHGNYLKGLRAQRGQWIPNNLPESDPTKMSFASDSTKAWKEHLGLRPGDRRLSMQSSVRGRNWGRTGWRAKYEAAKLRLAA